MPLHHSLQWAPTSHVGRWSVALAAGAVAGVALSVVGFAAGVLESASGFSDNWLLTGFGLAILATAAASAGTGGMAMVARHDRSLTVLLATILGTCALALVLNEVLQGL
ncbi:hypothetical protein [Nocardioides sp.]|uniref:hypothetical protein n=1 Tax=Nocardioides sp. TaxID=35761 RepID=UPI002D7F95DF|nr:hypothetical protein [Nocardioides sp.]HET8960167.1 hypothetical protein [Nocardioides sp.]